MNIGTRQQAPTDNDAPTLGAEIGRLTAILDELRNVAGRSEEGRYWAILATDAEKLLALTIGLNAADVPIPKKFIRP